MKKSTVCIFIFFITSLLLFVPGLTYGQSDFQEIRTPNVMIIFDTSSSMDMNTSGNSVSSGIAVGVDKVSRVYEGGANHPNSKLFIAKQALAEVLKDIEGVNLGFATYAQFKTEKRRGYYVRNRRIYTAPTPDQWRWQKLYWRFNNYRHSKNIISYSPNSFVDEWGTTHNNVTVGYEFYRTHTFDNSPANNGVTVPPMNPLGTTPGTYINTLRYRVNNIVYNAEYNQYTYYYDSDYHDHYEEQNRYIYRPNSNPIDCDADFSPTWGSYRTFKSTDSDQITNPGKWACSGPVLIPGFAGGFGNWYTEYSWLEFNGTSCPENSGSDNFPPNSNQWTKWTIVNPATCYDWSTYYYPADGSNNKPHTWSYFRISGNIWPNNIQPDPYYPAIMDDPGKSDNNFFFLNFPEIDDSLNNYANKKKILQWLDLMPVQNPETLRYHTKLPLKSDSITSNTIDSPFTPLADTLGQAKKYFNDYIYKYKGGDDATKATCRGNFIILMTDGLESAKFKGPNDPDYDAAATTAEELFKLVIDKNSNPAGVKTFVVGFGFGLMGNKPAVLDNIANSGGTGKAYFADNLSELKDAFKAIFQAISGNYSRSNPMITGTRDTLYKGYFTLPGWEGHLLAYELDKNGKIIDKNNDGKIDGNDAKWDAGNVMNSNGRGNIYTWADDQFEPNREDFDVGKSNKLKDKGEYLLNRSPEEDINEDGDKDGDDSETVIHFILDSNYDDCTNWKKGSSPSCHGSGYYKGKRSFTWKLGDIYHSTPLILGSPPFNFQDSLFPSKYSDFKTKWKSRKTMIYVGANDGMLHVFDSTDGKENFAVIPKNLLGKLREIRKDHQFFIDSSPKAFDVYHRKGKKKDEWKTIVVSGERGGGNYYFAIDVTDPSKKPDILWEMTDTAMGKTWSRPEIGLVRISGEEKFVIFVGGGHSDPLDPMFDNIGNTFYAIDIEDGTILRKFVVGDAKNKIPAGATAFDSDGDGHVNGVYFGDIKGALWKIKIDGEENISKWQLINLYTPATNSPVFYPPAVTKNNQGKIMVYYGQGDELNLFEKISFNSFFEIWDKGDSGQMIWEEKLRQGEKVLAAPALANNVIYFTTWIYTGVADDCGAGKGRLYGLTTTRLGVTGDLGALLLDPMTGTPMGSSKKYFEITDYFPESRGIPSAPIVTNGMIYISTSLNAGQVITIPVPGWGTGRLRYWREVF